MAAHYSRLNPVQRSDPSQEYLNPDLNDVPLSNMAGHGIPMSSDGSVNDYFGKADQTNVRSRPIFSGSRKNTGLSITSVASSPWEHKLNEKHLRDVPTQSETVRYFDPRRQTRRVFLDCLFMWFWTAGICATLAGIMYGFSTLQYGLSQGQKYAYNALITGFSIVLGLAFAAQFKQYAEMMRWRFLASEYRSLEDFEDVLGCDSYRSTIRIMWNGRRRGQFYPSKTQLIAAFWLVVFVMFNVCAALLGLTYSIDVSDTNVYVTIGNASVADLSYLASTQQVNGSAYDLGFQMAAANLWGQIGQNFPYFVSTLDTYETDPGAIWGNADATLFWYRFIDTSPNDSKTSRVSLRTVTSQASCVEYNITYGGYAGTQTDNNSLIYNLEWVDNQGNAFAETVTNVATGSTTWMGNTTGDCGPRCAQVLALLSANNLTQLPPNSEGGTVVPTPRLWACNNTVGQVANTDQDGFSDPKALELPDLQAQILAGAIGWTGITSLGSDLQFQLFDGDTIFNADGSDDGAGIAKLVMEFTVGAFSASDQFGGPRQNLTGPTPNPAQVVNVKWVDAGAILGGIPVVQFIMLLGVVWFASKAIILEPSFMTAAHLLYPVIQKVGKDGCLFTVDEMGERLGRGYKILYGVRPDAGDPGHHDTTFVRDLDIIEQSEGHGYIRGNMPEGRYD